MFRLFNSRSFRRWSGVLSILALLACSLAAAPAAEAADPLQIAYRGSQNFLSYSTRIALKPNPTKWDFALLTVEGGSRPYAVSMSNQILEIQPQSNGTQFYVYAKKVGTTIITIKDSKGQSLTRQVVVYDPSSLPLALGALPGSSNPVAVGQGRGFSVSGGKTPYKVVSANSGIARIEGPSQAGVWFVWGVAAGSTTITVTDAAGQRVQGTAYVGTTKPLSISANSTLLTGGKGELVISSGNPPYTVTTNAQLSAVLKGNDSYGRTVYTLTARSAGQGVVTVKDSKGLSSNQVVTVMETVTLSFPQLTGDLRTIDVGQATRLLVSGGKAPYTVSADKSALVTIQQQSTGQYTVTGRQAGVAGITAKDATGASRNLSLIVRALPTLTLAAPDSLLIGTTGNLSLIGGASPFTVTVSGNAFTLTKVEEKKYTLTPKAPGSAKLTVKDAKGTTMQKTIAVTAPALRLTGDASALQAGYTRPFDIKGGFGSYTLTLSNANAKAVLAQTTAAYTRYNITGVKAGTVILTAKDSQGKTAVVNLTIQPAQNPLKLFVSSNTLQLGATGAAAIRTLSIQGGTAPYTAAVSNNLLSLTQANTTNYQMIPRAPGTATITVTDSKGAKASQTMTVLAAVKANPLTMQLSATALQAGQSLEVRLGGGSGPYALQQISGPPLSLRQTAANVFLVSSYQSVVGSAQIMARDSRGETVKQTISLARPGSLPLSISLSAASVRRGQSVQIRLNGGTAPYRIYMASGPALQIRQTAGDVFTATGVVVGKSTIRAIDARNQYATATVTVTN